MNVFKRIEKAAYKNKALYSQNLNSLGNESFITSSGLSFNNVLLEDFASITVQGISKIDIPAGLVILIVMILNYIW